MSLAVLVDGTERPPPPDRAVAVLLVGLLAAGEAWTSRAEVARRLYPESDPATARNALRQATFRLRGWLGAEVVESRSGHVRLVPGVVAAPWEQAALLSDLSHPWADAIAEARARRPSLLPHLDRFARAVESAAEFDVDAARGILVGGSALVVNMPLDVAGRLLGLTNAADERAPLAFEHMALRGEVHLQALSLDRARLAFLHAYRIALARRSAARAFHAASMSAFAHTESGHMAGAAGWLERCAYHGRNRPEGPLLANARAALLWNSGRLDEAVGLMRAAAPNPDAADAAQRLHYWSNFAALASEAGDDEAALQADEEARGLARPGLHAIYLCTLDLARATRLMRGGRFDESLRAFESLRERTAAECGEASRAYADEGYAEALARAGEGRRAAQVWTRAETGRRAGNGRLTPRLAARKALILRAA